MQKIFSDYYTARRRFDTMSAKIFGNGGIIHATKTQSNSGRHLFDSVGGRLINEAVREGQEVSAGQIAQLDAQINSTTGNMQTSFFRADNNEQQSFRQIDSQRRAVNVARANVDTQQQLLDRLLAGVKDTGVTDSLNLPTISQERATAENIRNDIAALTQQKKCLKFSLKSLRLRSHG